MEDACTEVVHGRARRRHAASMGIDGMPAHALAVMNREEEDRDAVMMTRMVFYTSVVRK